MIFFDWFKKKPCEHQFWVQWEHGGSYPIKRFFKHSAILRNPKCVECGALKYKTKAEIDAYEQKLKSEGYNI